jgi:hypothetical protein
VNAMPDHSRIARVDLAVPRYRLVFRQAKRPQRGMQHVSERHGEVDGHGAEFRFELVGVQHCLPGGRGTSELL